MRQKTSSKRERIVRILPLKIKLLNVFRYLLTKWDRLGFLNAILPENQRMEYVFQM